MLSYSRLKPALPRLRRESKVVSAPVIQPAITGGQAQITGRFTATEAEEIVKVLTSGN